MCRPSRMQETLRDIAWDEVDRLAIEDLFHLARRYKELRFRSGSVGYTSMVEMDELKEHQIQENLYEMLKMHLLTQLEFARKEDLKIRIRVTRDSISIVGVGARPTDQPPKRDHGPSRRRKSVGYAH